MPRRKKTKTLSDFQRKKKKVGKVKRESDNVTRVNFKSGRVVVPCQWENSDVGGPSSNRKVSLGVLLVQLNHHNASVRHDALLGLREIFQRHPDLFSEHLPKFIEQVFSTVVDNSASVRLASHLLIKLFLSSVDNSVISPFFDTLIAHLNCGLTHIQDRIQLDSLKVLELYVKHCSSLLVQHVGSILEVLTSLLSRKTAVPSFSGSVKGRTLMGIIRKDASIDSNTTLSNNPGNNLLSKSSRLCIFKLIYSLLDLSLEAVPQSALVASSHDVLQDREKWLKLSGAVMSILLGSWVECHPDDVFRCKECPIQSLYLMESVINMLCILLKLLQRLTQDSRETLEGSLVMVDLYKKISGGVSAHILRYFPFRVAASSVRKQFQHFYVMNLTFCEVALLLWKLLSIVEGDVTNELPLAAIKYLGSLNSKDINYITSSVQNLTCSSILVNLAPYIYDFSHGGFEQDSALVGVFSFMGDFYGACHPHSKSKQLLVKCFSQILVMELSRSTCSASCVVMAKLLHPWSRTLLDLLSDLGGSSPETSSIVLESVAKAALHNSTALISELRQKLLPLIVSLEGCVRSFSESIQRKLVELLWHIPIMREGYLTPLSKLVVSGQFSTQYLIQIVHHKYMREDLDGTLFSSTPLYLSFMFTILMGFSTDCASIDGEVDHLADDNDFQKSKLYTAIVEKSSVAMSDGEYIGLHQTVCDCLKATSISSDVLTCLQKALLKLKVFSSLPVNSLCGVLTLGCSLGPLLEGCVSTALVALFGQLCVSCLRESTVVHCHQELLGHCLKLTYQMMSVSPPVLEAVVQLLCTMITSPNTAGLDISVRLLLGLLTHPDLHPILWGTRKRVNRPLTDTLVSLRSSSSPVGAMRELQLAVIKFLK